MSKMHSDGENNDIDYLFALQLHNDLNGDKAGNVFQVQRHRDDQDHELLEDRKAFNIDHSVTATIVKPGQTLGTVNRGQLRKNTTKSNIRKNITKPKFAAPSAVAIAVQKVQNPEPGPSSMVPKARMQTLRIPKQSFLIGGGAKASIVSKQKTISVDHSNAETEQMVTAVYKRSSPDDYFMPSLSIFITHGHLQDWSVIDMLPNVDAILNTIRSTYFKIVPKLACYAIAFSKNFKDQSNFKIDPVNRCIDLNRNTLITCSRGALMSVLLHIVIHICVYETSKSRTRKIDDHDDNFRQILSFFNKNLNLEIGTAHSFLRLTSNDDMHWYQCQGCCAKRDPFHGIIRATATATIQFTEHGHLDHCCNGNFHKIHEILRSVNNNTEVEFAVHKRFAEPKTQKPAEVHQKTNIKPREIIDITDENDSVGPTVVQTTDIIDLDDDEFSNASKKLIRKIVQHIKEIPIATFDKCPICFTVVAPFGGIGKHLDICLGFPIA